MEASEPTLTVEHAATGTLVYGASREDREAIRALKANGFRWSANLNAWYLPRNLTHDTRDRKVAALQADLGDRVQTEYPHGDRRLTAAENDKAKHDRAVVRAEQMHSRADTLSQASDAARKTADGLAAQIPLGQPILVGHHSEARARRDAERIRTNLDNAHAAASAAEAARTSAERAERVATGAESIVTISNRVERNQATVRMVERELASHAAAITILANRALDPGRPAAALARRSMLSPERVEQLNRLKDDAVDAIAYDQTKLEAAGGVRFGNHNVKAGDLIRTGRGWSPVVRANEKSATVPTGYTWTDTIPWVKVGEVKPAEAWTVAEVEALIAARPDDQHWQAALAKTLTRATTAEALESTPNATISAAAEGQPRDASMFVVKATYTSYGDPAGIATVYLTPGDTQPVENHDPVAMPAGIAARLQRQATRSGTYRSTELLLAPDAAAPTQAAVSESPPPPPGLAAAEEPLFNLSPTEPDPLPAIVADGSAEVDEVARRRLHQAQHSPEQSAGSSPARGATGLGR